jgi:hypothetical protein
MVKLILAVQTGVCGIVGVHVSAVGTAVDLARPKVHQLLRRGRQR